jgi:autotransporter adhesin
MFACAIGANTKAGHVGTVALGAAANVAALYGSALGTQAVVTVDYGVALGCGSVCDRPEAVSVGEAGIRTRQIVNVAAGTEANDAVNFEQFLALRAELAALSKRMAALENVG